MACWAEDPDLQAWKNRTQRSYGELFSAFQQRVVRVIYNFDRIPLAWQGRLDDGVLSAMQDPFHPEEKLILQPWKCRSRLAVRDAVASLDGTFGRHQPSSINCNVSMC